MDFGSEFILQEEEADDYDDVEERTPYMQVDSDDDNQMQDDDNSEFECEIISFDEEEEQHPPSAQKSAKINVNTISLAMSSLQEKPDHIITSPEKPVLCKCGVAYSHINQVTDGNDGKKVWKCKFCDEENDLTGVVPDLQKDHSDVMYLRNPEEPLPCLKHSDIPSDLAQDDSKVIFMIDVSASMCQPVTGMTPKEHPVLQIIVEKDYQHHQVQMQVSQMLSNAGPQLMPFSQAQTPRNEVTRLQAIKAAVITLIAELKTKQPNKKVGLVEFSDKVVIHGDGNRCIEITQPNDLEDKFKLMTIGMQNQNLQPIRETADVLVQKIEEFKDNGRTALGPALVVALCMAADVKGSKIILCTDGYANIGLGRIEDATEDKIKEFYNGVIDQSKVDCTSVSIIACDEAGLKTRLGDVPPETGGTLKYIDTKASEHTHTCVLNDINMLDEINRPIIAFHGRIEFFVHKDMFVDCKKDQLSSTKDKQPSSTVCNIGNILGDKKIVFSYGFKTNPDAQKDDKNTSTSQSGGSSSSQTGTAQNSSDEKPESKSEKGHGDPQAAQVSNQQGLAQDLDQHSSLQVTSQQSSPQNNLVPCTKDPRESSQDATKQGSASETKGSADPDAAPKNTQMQDDDKIEKIPFQVHIEYEDKKGNLVHRIWTKEKPKTTNRAKAESAASSASAENFIQVGATEILSKRNERDINCTARQIYDECKVHFNSNNLNTEDKQRKLIEFMDIVKTIASNGIVSEKDVASLTKFKEGKDFLKEVKPSSSKG